MFFGQKLFSDFVQKGQGVFAFFHFLIRFETKLFSVVHSNSKRIIYGSMLTINPFLEVNYLLM